MEELRRASVLSNSSSASVPATDKPKASEGKHHGLQSGKETTKRLKQQVRSLKEENEQLSEELSRLRQRTLDYEEEKVSLTTAFNKENALNLACIARLESQLEKGEASRQAIEFDMAVVKKKSNDIMRTTSHRESNLTQENKVLAEEKSALEIKIEDLEKALQIARRVTMEDEKRIAFLMDEKKQIEADKLASEAVLRSHHDKLVEEKTISNAKADELKNKIKDLESALIKQEEEMRQKLADIQVISEREQSARVELNNVTLRCRALEESVEAERASHLESKFNAEIIQLKQHESDAALTNSKELNEKLKLELADALKKSAALAKELENVKTSADDANEKLAK